MSGFSFLSAALCITVLCVVFCIAYISYNIKESRSSVRLLDAKLPFSAEKLTEKVINRNVDIYDRPTSDARLTLRLFYAADDLEELRRQASPNKLPKGRNKI